MRKWFRAAWRWIRHPRLEKRIREQKKQLKILAAEAKRRKQEWDNTSGPKKVRVLIDGADRLYSVLWDYHKMTTKLFRSIQDDVYGRKLD